MFAAVKNKRAREAVIHRRLETRWVKPVRSGDTIQPAGIVKLKQVTANSSWVPIDVMVRNQNDEKVATLATPWSSFPAR
jgi:acyl dehydratase